MISIAIHKRWWLGIGLIVLIAACASPSKPSLKLSATPTSLEDGQTLTLKAEATAGQGSKVEFYKNGEKVGEDTAVPFELSLPIVSNDDATLVFSAKVLAADGQSGISEAVSVNVKVDKEAPKISLAASNSNLNAAGAVTLTANATDNKGVVKVEFYKGTEKLGEDTTAADGFSLVVNLTDADNGSLKYTAKAYDKKGNVGTSAEVAVSVDIDVTNPTISLSANKISLTTAGSAVLTADASDNKGVSKVEFYEGDNKLAEDTEAPFTYQISFTAANNGNHSYTAKAFDVAGNSAASGEVTITVDIDATLPVVSLTSDKTSITKAGSALLSAEASDDKGISKVEFYLVQSVGGETKLSEDSEAPYTHTLNFTDADNGTYSYTAKAYDSNGNIATADPVSISVDIDAVAPQVSLSANPTSLDAVGTITLTATASDNKSISRVEFYKGTTLLGTDTDGSDGYKHTAVYNASYSATDSFTAKAFDPSGNQASSDTISLPIDIDLTAPTVSLSTSTSLLTSPDTITFTATSSDNRAVTKLEFYQATLEGDVLIDTIYNPAASKQISLTVDAEVNGTLTYYAKAYDAKNNASTATASVVVAIKPSITKFEAAPGSSLALSDAGGTVDLVWDGENVQSYLLVPSGSLVVTIPIPGDTGNTSGRLTLPANTTNQAKTYTVTLNAKAYGTGIPDATQILAITVAADATPPVISSFTASNTNVTTASTITLEAQASDAASIDRVEFWEGNTKLGEDTSSPYGWNLGYTYLDNGSHSYTAKVFDKNGNSTPSSAVSVTVNIFGYIQLSPGVNYSCAIGSNGNAYCWGNNTRGQFGNNSTLNSLTPVAVTMPSGIGFTQIAAGIESSCALGSDGKAYCWGWNRSGKLGDGSTTDRLVPTEVVMTNVPSGVSFSKIAIMTDHACALGSDGKGYCWGDGNLTGQTINTSSKIPLAVVMPSGITFSQLALGWAHACAVGSDGKVYCWGLNYSSQLGDDSTSPRYAPVAVKMPDGISFSSVSAGPSHTCAVGSDSQAYCWGQGTYGQLGNNATSNLSVPTAVTMPGGVSITEVAGGNRHSCALSSDGKVYCWGSNALGQLGNGTTAQSLTPTLISMPSGVTFSQLVTRTDHTCAKGSDRKYYCWGDGGSGKLGSGSGAASTTPVVVITP